MNGTINMFLLQVAREKAVPLNLSLNPARNVFADLMHMDAEREAGYIGREADEVLAEDSPAFPYFWMTDSMRFQLLHFTDFTQKLRFSAGYFMDYCS